MKSAQELLTELVKIPSVSHVDNTPVIELLATWFPNYELKTEEWTREDGVPGKNLIVKIPGKDSASSLVFVCHMDTVPESKEWKTDPFTLTEKEGRLFGLGSCDTKGGTASLIEAVLTLEGKPKVDTYLVFSGDEEVTSAGVGKLRETTTFSNPQFVFIEPTDNKVLISQRGVLQMDIITHGISQHGSYATPEENAKNSATFKMALAMGHLNADAHEITREQDALLGSNTQNFGVLEGGTARNVMADKCALKLDRRLLPTRNGDKEAKRIEEFLKAKDASIEVIKVVAHPSFSTPEDSPLVQAALFAMRKNGRNEGIGGFQAWSEAGLFADLGDVIILGPASISQAHRANEFIEKKDLEDYVKIFQDLILGA